MLQSESIFATIAEVIWRPFAALASASDVQGWFFLGTAYLIVVIAIRRHLPKNERGFVRRLSAIFPKNLWTHPSSLADIRFFIVNKMLAPFYLAGAVLASAWIGFKIAGAITALFGPVSTPLGSGTLMIVVFTLALFIAYDFGRFLAHHLMHEVPVLWEFHKVHHSAEVLQPFTTARGHPVEFILFGMLANIMQGIVMAPFVYVTAGEIGPFHFLGANVFNFLFYLSANIRHMHVPISFGPLLDKVFISPAQHQVHHSALQKHWGANRGYALAIWDRSFGTHYIPEEGETFPLGLGDEAENARYHGVVAMYLLPFKTIWQSWQSPQQVEADEQPPLVEPTSRR